MPPAPRNPGRVLSRVRLGALLLAASLLLVSCRKPAVSAPSAPKVIEEDLTAKLKAVQAEVASLEQAAATEYRALDARRAKLVGAAPADVEAFNRDAAQYQLTREALQRRHEELKALAQAEGQYRQVIAQRERPAVELLNRLRDAVDTNNWSLQLVCLEEALAKYSETKTFASITAVAKPQLARITRADIERLVAARPVIPEFQAVTQQIQAIVNQTPTTRPDKVGSTVSIGFHAGAIKPNFKAITLPELKRGREFYNAETAWMQDAPNVFYLARETEFNPMTKYFYTDRSKAKKRLSDAEYDRLLVLYHRLGELEGQPVPTAASMVADTWGKWEKLKNSWP